MARKAEDSLAYRPSPAADLAARQRAFVVCSKDAGKLCITSANPKNQAAPRHTAARAANRNMDAAPLPLTRATHVDRRAVTTVAYRLIRVEGRVARKTVSVVRIEPMRAH